MRHFSLLLLVNAFLIVAADDKFIFDVTFNCGYHQRESYNYNVQFVEWDFSSPNDQLTQQKIGIARPGASIFQMEGSLNGDEIFSSGYEVGMKLFHDCTEYEKQYEATIWLKPLCEIGKGMCHYTIDKDIKDLRDTSTYEAKLSYQ
ncbi:unnamed protein product [Caenorhabditis sp. 36 PRJEB53466]|nr:unnamed protein product [Caenorhabditis sp. 36 PRJEB53466]